MPARIRASLALGVGILLTQLWIMPVPASDLARSYSGKGLSPAVLRCEYKVNPLGIDEPAPRLSWEVQSGERAQRQTAYRILVATSQQLLTGGFGDLWDSTLVPGDETTSVIYNGKPLQSNQRCYWKVKVWDKNGRESHWSETAIWSMGLLKPEDWKAEWVGYDKPRKKPLEAAPFTDAKWLWHAADAAGHAPKCQRLFWTRFTLLDNVKIKQAELFATADDGMVFALNGGRALSTEARNDSWRQVRNTDVTARIHPGTNELRVLVENEKEGDAGLLAKLIITAQDGQTFTQVTDDSWKSSEQVPQDWFNGPLDTSEWPAARVVGDYGVNPWGELKVSGLFLPPATFFRNRFRIEKQVTHATLYGTALGLVEFHLNGRPVSDDFFTPGWTDYPKRVYYRAYDVTPLLRKGDNGLGAILADGWFSGYVGYRGARDLYGKNTRLRAQLHIDFADGTSTDIATGPDWKATTGPILQADFLQGETYDARKELANWDQPNCDDSSWDYVNVGGEEVHRIVQAHPGPPVREIQEFRAKKITEPEKGVYVLDLGQNFAGAARLKIYGRPGQKITLRFAERLNPDGTIYTTNLRSAHATDTYICKGSDLEIWEPHFTFHGFQYIEVSGLTGKPHGDTVVGVALSSDTPVVGEFACSDPMLNKLRNNIYWTQRANFIDIPTDCPQRDERLGWTGDAQVYARAAALQTDVHAFFTKWLIDLDEDGQRADGQFPCVAPVKVADADGGPAWADAGVICPWTIYSVYDDHRVLERHYEAMKKFIEFCRNRSTPELLPPARYHCFGDWLSIKADTPKDVIYTAYFAYSTKLTARTAEVLGKTDEAKQFNTLFDKIKEAFNKAYVAPDGRIKGDTQTCYVLALAFDLVDGERAKQAAQYLIEDIKSRDWHLSTGFVGTKDLMPVLSKIGRTDVAYRLLHNDTFPSWGFSIQQGATSIWERWDGWTPEKGFQDAGMNSFAHYSFGAVYQWMVDYLGGILRAAPGYKQILIAPQLDEQLSFANVSYHSIHGVIATAWKWQGNKLLVDVMIPANTTAMVAIPARAASDVTEGGHHLSKAEGVKFLRMDGSNALLSVGSGRYAFAVTQR
jgi:alpha-L-rhamnosidase